MVRSKNPSHHHLPELHGGKGLDERVRGGAIERGQRTELFLFKILVIQLVMLIDVIITTPFFIQFLNKKNTFFLYKVNAFSFFNQCS
jgi:hypothetical protein